MAVWLMELRHGTGMKTQQGIQPATRLAARLTSGYGQMKILILRRNTIPFINGIIHMRGVISMSMFITIVVFIFRKIGIIIIMLKDQIIHPIHTLIR